MKDKGTKQKFIELRAKGYSYSKIAKQLNISKSTCGVWDKEFKDQIASINKDQLEELYQSYGMMKQQRISSLGKMLNKIDDAIDEANFSNSDPVKLMELRLKYQEALKSEYIPLDRDAQALDSDTVLKELSLLIDRIKHGEIGEKEAGIELKALSTALGAYDKTVLENKLDSLKDALEGVK